MALSFFNANIFTEVRAGFALNIISSLVKGLMPLRALVAGFLIVFILSNPGRVNSPTARFLMCLSMISEHESNTLATCALVRFTSSAMLAHNCDLVKADCNAVSFLVASAFAIVGFLAVDVFLALIDFLAGFVLFVAIFISP